ncbi:hypothetical protein KA037_02560 [Patescibacteria group bacterium]|nr:hypothetical protein [Patescibacteria group bacterium]
MDVAGYSLISAQNTEQFMIGFKLSSAPTDLTAPDSVMLTLYYADSTKASSSLSQDVDGYYVGSNSFAYDDNITSAVVTAYSTID